MVAVAIGKPGFVRMLGPNVDNERTHEAIVGTQEGKQITQTHQEIFTE